jgi:hypothetical protein
MMVSLSRSALAAPSSGETVLAGENHRCFASPDARDRPVTATIGPFVPAGGWDRSSRADRRHARMGPSPNRAGIDHRRNPALDVLVLIAVTAAGAMALAAELYLGGRRARKRL